MVLHDHVHVELRRELGEPRQAVGGQLLLLLEFALARRVDPDRVAAQPLRRLDPRVVLLDRRGAGLVIGVAEVAEAVAHDQDVRHALVGRPLGEVGDVVGVLGLVLEELVDVLDPVDAELLLRRPREVEVVELAREERVVERPLGERDFECRLRAGRGFSGGKRPGRAGQRAGDGGRGGEERAAGGTIRGAGVHSGNPWEMSATPGPGRRLPAGGIRGDGRARLPERAGALPPPCSR